MFFLGGKNQPAKPTEPSSRNEAMTKVEATQLKAAARHLKSVSSRKEADKMVAKVPPVGWAGGIRFGAEFKRMKRMNEIDIQEKSLKKKI